MEKKQYNSPAMRVVKLQVRHMLAGSDTVRSMDSNANLNNGGGSSNNVDGQVRSNGHRGIWDGME